MSSEIEKIIDSIDLKELDGSFLKPIYNKFSKYGEKMNENEFIEFKHKINQYKLRVIRILHKCMKDNNIIDINISKDELVKLASMPFVIPLDLDEYNLQMGFNKDNNYININILTDYDLYLEANTNQIKFALQLYGSPRHLIIYCLNLIIKFIRVFYKDSKPKQRRSCCRKNNGKNNRKNEARMIYEYSNE